MFGLSQNSLVGSTFTMDGSKRSTTSGYVSGRASPQLDHLRKSPTLEQAVQTASTRLPASAAIGRRSPVSARPLASTSHKTLENQEHRRGRNQT